MIAMSVIALLMGGLDISQEKLEWTLVKKGIRIRFPSVTQLSTERLSLWSSLPDTTQPVLLDAREREEYEVSHLRGAWLASSEKKAVAALKKVGKNHPVVVYCSVGYRSSELAVKLHARGFTNVYNLEGSIFQWANEGRPVYSDKGKVKNVHPFNSTWGQLLEKELWFRSPEPSH